MRESALGKEFATTWTLNAVRWTPEAVFAAQLPRFDLPALRQEFLAIERPNASLNDLGTPLVRRRHRNGTTLVLDAGEAVALLDVGRDSAQVEIVAGSDAVADGLFESIAAMLVAATPPANVIEVALWAHTQHGSRAARRRITVPTWSEIRRNYAPQTVCAIAELLDQGPPDAGRLLLLHGTPGTGKTKLGEALLLAFNDWCSAHVITDPEALLGGGTGYLLDVLTARDQEPGARTDRWRLIILEDAGELLTLDAHMRTGQALSRLLNVTDGMIGQGTNAIVLVSTNEDLGKLHPAIQRPGRCWKQIEFLPLDAEQANSWLTDHGSKSRVTEPTTLAELYAIAAGTTVSERPAFGFAAA
jgi:hypothetical protein